MFTPGAKRPMTAAIEKSFSRWKVASLLGAVTFFSLIYFYEGGGWNQNSRFDLLRAIVEQHTLQIDAYHENTQDKAHFQGHYYSDKAPGLVFLAVPVALAATTCVASCGDRSGIGARRVCAVVVGDGSRSGAADGAGWNLLIFSRVEIRVRLDCGGVRDGGDVRGNADLGLWQCVLGACVGGSLSGVCVCVGCEAKRERERRRGFWLGVGRGFGSGMGDGNGVSSGTGVSDPGVLSAGAGVAARKCSALARYRWSGIGRRGLSDCIAELFARGVWIVSSQLFVLRSEFVFVYAAAGLYGINVSASRPAVEAFVRMFAGIVFCVSGADRRAGGIVVVVERETVFVVCFSSGGNSLVLLPF